MITFSSDMALWSIAATSWLARNQGSSAVRTHRPTLERTINRRTDQRIRIVSRGATNVGDVQERARECLHLWNNCGPVCAREIPGFHQNSNTFETKHFKSQPNSTRTWTWISLLQLLTRVSKKFVKKPTDFVNNIFNNFKRTENSGTTERTPPCYLVRSLGNVPDIFLSSDNLYACKIGAWDEKESKRITGSAEGTGTFQWGSQTLRW